MAKSAARCRAHLPSRTRLWSYNAEIEENGAAEIVRYHDVVGFNVAMNQPQRFDIFSSVAI